MQAYQNIEFFNDISNQVKQFYETAIIFVTKKDYSDILFNTFCSVYNSLQKKDKNHTLELIVDYHLNWLHDVNDLEAFKKSIQSFKRNDFCESIIFTIDALSFRKRRYHTYVENHKTTLNSKEQADLQADLEIIDDMHTEVTRRLVEKIKDIKSISIKEFTAIVNKTVDELLQWLDKINDGLSTTLCKYMNVHTSKLADDLPKILQQIVAELKNTHTESSKKNMEELNRTGQEIGSMVHFTTGHSLEMKKLSDQIKVIDDRINHMETEMEHPATALVAVKNRKLFLEKRLNYLESLKTNLKHIQELISISIVNVPDEELCICEDFFQLRIFNHRLPQVNRERLVTELCYLWDMAVLGEVPDKSIISILSAADKTEEFTDDLGTFTVDEYGRKIYKLPNDDTLYQINERSELVPLSDDNEHTYFYDECGRYYMDDNLRQRVYKVHATASEYMMNGSGVLLKVKEVRDGVTYYYDNYGRYYINEEGKHIYRATDAISEYENDAMGNLVRIRSQPDIFLPCPGDTNVTEDFRYLKETVGKALRQCLGQVLILQPSDPIRYLSKCLIKYRENMELRDKRDKDQEELNIERELIASEERAAAEKAAKEAALLSEGCSEASFDSNLVKYTTFVKEEPVSAEVSTK